jgi:sulfur relay (sulfurtransferase) DsrF/TusC family protein
MRVLNIVETAYRATLEEQDDTVLWITRAMRGAGAEIDVLLQGNAVNYAARAQHVAPLGIGGHLQKRAPGLADDVAALIAGHAAVYVVVEDIADRGLASDELVGGVKPIRKAELPELFDRFDGVWQW